MPFPPFPPSLRNWEEIQRAHDLLYSVLENSEIFEDSLPEGAMNLIAAYLDVCCWVLNHQTNDIFANRLLALEKLATTFGLELVTDEEISGATKIRVTLPK